MYPSSNISNMVFSSFDKSDKFSFSFNLLYITVTIIIINILGFRSNTVINLINSEISNFKILILKRYYSFSVSIIILSFISFNNLIIALSFS